MGISLLFHRPLLITSLYPFPVLPTFTDSSLTLTSPLTMPSKRKAVDDAPTNESERGPVRPAHADRTASESVSATVASKRNRRSSSPIKQSIETDDQPRLTRRRTRGSVDVDTIEVANNDDRIAPSSSASRKTPRRAASRQTSISSQARSTRAAASTAASNHSFDADLNTVQEESVTLGDRIPKRAQPVSILKSPKKDADLEVSFIREIAQFDELHNEHGTSDAESEGEDAKEEFEGYAAMSRRNASRMSTRKSPNRAAGYTRNSSFPASIRLRSASSQGHSAPLFNDTVQSFSPSVSSGYAVTPWDVEVPARPALVPRHHPVESPSRQFLSGHSTRSPIRDTPYNTGHGTSRSSLSLGPALNPFRQRISMSANGIPQPLHDHAGHALRETSNQRSQIARDSVLRKTSPSKRRPLFGLPSNIKPPHTGEIDSRDGTVDRSADDMKNGKHTTEGSPVDHYGELMGRLPRVQAAIRYLSGYDTAAPRPSAYHEEAYAMATRRRTLLQVFVCRLIEAGAFLGTRRLSVPLSALGAGLLFSLTIADDVPMLEIIGHCLQDLSGVAVRLVALFLCLTGLCDVVEGMLQVFQGIGRRTWRATQIAETSGLFHEALVQLCREWIWLLLIDMVNYILPPAAMLILTTVPVVQVNTSADSGSLELLSTQSCWTFVGLSLLYHSVAWVCDSVSRHCGPRPPSRRSLGLHDFWSKVVFLALLIIYVVRQHGLIRDVAQTIPRFYSMAQAFYTDAHELTGAEGLHRREHITIVHTSIGEGPTVSARWASVGGWGAYALTTPSERKDGPERRVQAVSEVWARTTSK